MSGLFQFVGRIYNVVVGGPNHPTKRDDAIRVGLLGASTIAPIAVINPAKSHPEVIVASVAARDKSRASAYAKKHGIPNVHGSYQELIDDPTIDAIYIALPNSHHFEWALRSLKAGKHVLLEKPSTSNSTEAKALFNHPLVTSPNAPVLLEAFHYRFHPAWQTFLHYIRNDPQAGPITWARSEQYFFKGAFPMTDIRFSYKLAGGAMMDFATYPISMLRSVFDAEPEVVDNATSRGKDPVKPKDAMPGDEHVDTMISANYRFPNGAVGEMHADLAYRGASGWPSQSWPRTSAKCAEKVIDDSSLANGKKHFVQRSAVMWNHIMPFLYHRIDLTDIHSIKDANGNLERTWTEKKNVSAYKWPLELKSGRRVGEEWWSTYRHQLEEFVHRIRGRNGSGVWIEHTDSVAQMEAIDKTYEKVLLPPRPTSEFKVA